MTKKPEREIETPEPEEWVDDEALRMTHEIVADYADEPTVEADPREQAEVDEYHVDHPIIAISTVEPDPVAVVVSTTPPVFRRLSLDNPPPRLAHFRRAQQKPMIARINALQQQGIDAREAIEMVLAGTQ